MEVEIPTENLEQPISPRRVKLRSASRYSSGFEMVIGLLLLFLSLPLYVYDPAIEHNTNTKSTTTLATPTTTITSTANPPSPPPSPTNGKDFLMIAIYIVRGVLSIVKATLLGIFLQCVPLKNQKSTRLLSAQMIFALVQIPLTIASAILLIIRTNTWMIYLVVCDPFILIFVIVFFWIVHSYKKELLVFLENRNPNQNPVPELPITSQSIKREASRQLLITGAQLLTGALQAIPEPEVQNS